MHTIAETKVTDPRGEVIISPGLKVRHKDSQFEYTVDGVFQDDSGDIKVALKLPDEPRFNPDPPSSDVIHARSKKQSSIIYEIDPNVLYFEPDQDQLEDSKDEAEMISVSQKEFEQDYEVK